MVDDVPDRPRGREGQQRRDRVDRRRDSRCRKPRDGEAPEREPRGSCGNEDDHGICHDVSVCHRPQRR